MRPIDPLLVILGCYAILRLREAARKRTELVEDATEAAMASR